MIWIPNDPYVKHRCESELSNKRIKFGSIAVRLSAGFIIHILWGWFIIISWLSFRMMGSPKEVEWIETEWHRLAVGIGWSWLKIMVFSIVVSYSFMHRGECWRGIYTLHLCSFLKWRQYISLKSWYLSATLHGVITLKVIVLILIITENHHYDVILSCYCNT